MPHGRKLLYLVADGAHARMVRRNVESGDFETFQEMDGASRLRELREEQRDEAPGRSYESATSARHGVGREDAYRRAKAQFAAEIAEAVADVLDDQDWNGVVLAAPSRILPVLKDHMAGAHKVVGTLAKDLTKVPDHELARWLAPLGD